MNKFPISPLFIPGNKIEIWAGHLGKKYTIKKIIENIMSEPIWPVGIDVFNGLANIRRLHRANLDLLAKKYQLEDIKLLSVSKGPERNSGREIVHLENKNINLKPNDVLLNFIQRLSDEAHRFAITAHRSRRSKSSTKSVFDEIRGIGPKRKKDLLLHFGTIKKIKSASLEELKKIKTIPLKKLQELFEFFNS